MATFDPSWCGVHPGLTTPHGPAPTAGPLLVPLRGMPVYYTYLASPGALSAQPRAVYLTYPQRSETPAPAASFRVHHPTHIAQAAASYRHCLPRAANPGYHRVLIQGSSLNYLGQTPGQSLQYSPNQVHRAILPNLPGRIINDTIKNSAVTCPATRSVAPVTVNTQTKFAHTIAQKTNPVDFTNLDLLSTVSLRDRTKPHVDNVPKKIEQLKPKRPSKLDLSAPQTIQHRVSITETAVAECSPAHPASALGLVAVAAIRKPAVWLNVTLQVDTTAEVKRGQPCAQYRSLITNILTEIYFPPCLSAPDDLLPDDMSATATYDDRGRLTVLQVEYIGPGIYRVESDGGGSPGRSCAQAVSLSRVNSLETLEPSSQYFILGDLCPVPKTFLRCHRNAQPLQKKIAEYLYSREFRKYTLPLLTKSGEEDVWTRNLRVPRTRSRVSDYDDLAIGDQSLKRKSPSDATKTLLPRKAKKLSRTCSVSSTGTSPGVSPVASPSTSGPEFSPCTSPVPSACSPPLFLPPTLASEDSCDSVFSADSSASVGPPVLVRVSDVTIESTPPSSSPPTLEPAGKTLLTSHSTLLTSHSTSRRSRKAIKEL